MVSGQITGKFRSLNEPMINTMLEKSLQQKSTVMFKDCNVNLKTEDDYGETLTASSEDSPYRGPSERVKRAAQLTTKAYIEDVNKRVQNVMQKETCDSIREFGPRKMKAAYQGINERQGARLQFLKQQMKESLIETHQLQAKLQNLNTSDQAKNRGGLSQFNSLVLDFSQNLENMATSLIQATESKRKNLRMKNMIAEIQETRRQRSMSKSAPNSARKQTNSLTGSRHISPSKSNSASKRSSISKAKSSPSKSSRNNSRKSLRKSSSRKLKKGNKLSRKRTQSGKKLKSRSKTNSVKSLRRPASYKSAKKSQRSASVVSLRGRSRSSKRIASVKRNIFEQTNGFRNTEPTAFILKPKFRNSRQTNQTQTQLPAFNMYFTQNDQKPKRSVSRKSRSRPKSKSASRKRSNSQTVKTRVDEVAQKCKKLVNHKFEVTKGLKTVMSKLRMRSTSKGKVNLSKPRKSRSKSRKKLARKGTKSKSKSKSKVRKNSKTLSNRGSKGNAQATPQPTLPTPNLTPMMTPLHKILRNSMGDHDISGIMRTGRKVQICSRKLQDITQLASSDSDSSFDSEDSLDNERYLKQQQAHLSPWQRACVRKQLPKKLR